MLSRLTWTAAVLLAAAPAACGPEAPAAGAGVLQVVAGENFWGDVAGQLGGTRANVQSVVTDPNADPHEYESNTNDARAFAVADLVILNGAGYDDWGRRLLDANPGPRRRVLQVADLLGKKAGDNPHFWYDPDYVTRVADRITAEYMSLDPADTGYFDQQRGAFTRTLQPYLTRLAEIRQKFAGAPVGATETLFTYLADYLGLRLITPRGFMQAVGEGNDPPASSVVAFQDQIASREINVLIYNVQTASAVTTNLRLQAAQRSIPVVGMSETLQPVTSSFQDWQDGQLQALEKALDADAQSR